MSGSAEPKRAPLVFRAFANRKSTSLTATLVLDLILTALWFWPLVSEHSWAPVSLVGLDGSEFAVWSGFGVLNALLYPFAREIYFRLTGFIPRITTWGGDSSWQVLSVMLVILKLAALIYTWLLAVPLGAIGGVYLVIQEHAGRGYRRAS
ncbi:hypothetical protein DFO66_10523 [Brevibacterium sanguinis]|uniref:Uncharacterized protein n=2 Tax=Brevibacterium TaxID=1696 RepID=A0A366IIN0_9MICO|nr:MULTISPECIES: hypothetical protein [Brevibacterium]RBP64917.1 hypothetical protein DFO66_10523 [Brevibacterium sanguinis]RBP71180.1 hypothetical protein DFO65_10623 [Brevibacterium celere]